MTHGVRLSQVVVERVLERRGRLHLFEALDPRRTALVIVDMQNAFVAPGAPVEVPAARAIVPAINRLAAALRALGATVAWVLHENRPGGTDWPGFFEVFVRPERRAAAAAALAPGSELQKLWPALEPADTDLFVSKNRYSAFIQGASSLHGNLKDRGVDTVLVAGTKTNVCCESTARDAMMLDYKVAILSDCTAALSDAEHLATLENVIQQFGDVLTADEALALLGRPTEKP